MISRPIPNIETAILYISLPVASDSHINDSIGNSEWPTSKMGEGEFISSKGSSLGLQTNCVNRKIINSIVYTLKLRPEQNRVA